MTHMHTMTEQPAAADMWRAVAGRDAAFDGAFVYAVASTGVFCRPSCPSRRPRRDRVRFYPTPAAAQAAGYRPCRRCRPDLTLGGGDELAERALALIASRLLAEDEGAVTLAALAAALDSHPGTLRRRFQRAFGLTPRAYAEALRRQRFQDALRGEAGVADAIYAAGYGSPSRVYENGGGRLGMTPATYARGGRGAHIRYATAPCALDRVLVAATARGVCAVYLGDDDAALEGELRREFPQAEIAPDSGPLADAVRSVVSAIDDGAPARELALDVRASAFQARVWQALRAIPAGETRTYGDIAESLGAPGAARAVARACATNPVSVVVPCHRVVRRDGGLGGYRWGLARKQRLLAREAGTG